MRKSRSSKSKNKSKTKSKTKSKLKTFKQLQRKYWPAIRYLVIRRDKHCQICGDPRPPFDVDHFISRGNHRTFFDIRNLTLLCKPCHYKKTYGVHGWDIRLYKVVDKREGSDTIEELMRLSKMPHKWTEEEIEGYISDVT